MKSDSIIHSLSKRISRTEKTKKINEAEKYRERNKQKISKAISHA